jgi:hypothetical protein
MAKPYFYENEISIVTIIFYDVNFFLIRPILR